MDAPEIGGFTQVDQAVEPGAFVNFLRTVSASSVIQRYKRQTLAILDPRLGDHVLDVGCGLGDDARELARLVGPLGHIIGVDASAEMIDEARRRAQDVDVRVEFRCGDAHQLEFPNDTFDRCRADRTLHHIDDPRLALSELVRVARPGGRVVVSEPDFGTIAIDAMGRELTQAILRVRCNSLRSPWIGRQLPRMFAELGLRDVAVQPEVLVFTEYGLANQMMGLEAAVETARGAGLVSGEAGAVWLGNLRDANQRKHFFATATIYVVSGQKS